MNVPVRVVAAVLGLLCATFALKAASPPGVATNWGDTSYGMAVLPGGLLTNVTMAACGLYHNLILKGDGTLRAWGAGTTNTGSAPNYGQAVVPAVLTNAAAIAAGNYHSLALTSNGTVIAWGYNADGEINVPSGLKNIVAIAAGSLHSLAVKSDGTVVAWGYDGFGETNVPAGLTNAIRVAGGDVHSLALQANGTVVAWGGNSYGQTNVPPGLTNAVAIAAGADHSLVLKADGTVIAWGYNGSGQTNVPPGLSNVVAVAAGAQQSVALTAGGVIVTWGAVTNFPAGLTNIGAIAAGGSHGLAVTWNAVLLAQPPAAISLAAGSNTNLSVSVWSGSAFGCQWSLNGSPIPGATGATLFVTNFSLSTAGTYSARITNQYSSIVATTVLRLSNSPAILVDGIDVGGGTVTRVASSQITMTNTGSGNFIFYTLDGTAPEFTSNPYNGPFPLTNSAVINAIAYNSAYTASALAAPIFVEIPPVYPLVAGTAGGGAIAASPPPNGGVGYISNTVVSLTATPSNGWSFIDWTGDSTGTTNVITLLMNEPHAAQAVFGTTLSLFTNGNGAISLDPPNGPYPYGSQVEFNAQPASGSYFFGWAGNANGFNNPLTVIITNAEAITALFGALNSNQVTLSVTPVGNGRVTVSPYTNVFTNGQTITLTAFPGSNSIFTGWSGGVATTTNPVTFSIAGNEFVTATFVPGSSTNLPVITQPPLSRTLNAGGSTTLGFQATGPGPFSYQWYFGALAVYGATNSTLALNDVTPNQAGLYSVVVTGATGSTTSAPASVALLSLLLVPSESQSLPLLILTGAPGTSYQLQYSADLSMTNWTLLEGVTLQGNESYFVDVSMPNNSNRFYRAVPQ
jgi:hypothetical protein